MAFSPKLSDGRIDLSQPRWDQSTFLGRLKHFASITDPRLVIVTKQSLLQAKQLLLQYKNKEEPKVTTDTDIWRAKTLYDSAFHPDSGQLQNSMGRMSFQVPGGMILTAGMLQFYNTTRGVVISQWLNQSFNALVNYTNRNAASSLSTKQIGVAYVSATSCALITALGFKSFMLKRAPQIVQRFVPFLAVVAANMVNIPLSRQAELKSGVVLFDDDNKPLSQSRAAAIKGISLVTLSRITMAAPGMLTMPLIMNHMEKKAWFMKHQRLHIVFQTFMIGCLLIVMVPVACAMFPQNSSISMDTLKRLEPCQHKEVLTACHQLQKAIPTHLYFNKGL